MWIFSILFLCLFFITVSEQQDRNVNYAKYGLPIDNNNSEEAQQRVQRNLVYDGHVNGVIQSPIRVNQVPCTDPRLIYEHLRYQGNPEVFAKNNINEGKPFKTLLENENRIDDHQFNQNQIPHKQVLDVVPEQKPKTTSGISKTPEKIPDKKDIVPEPINDKNSDKHKPIYFPPESRYQIPRQEDESDPPIEEILDYIHGEVTKLKQQKQLSRAQYLESKTELNTEIEKSPGYISKQKSNNTNLNLIEISTIKSSENEQQLNPKLKSATNKDDLTELYDTDKGSLVSDELLKFINKNNETSTTHLPILPVENNVLISEKKPNLIFKESPDYVPNHRQEEAVTNLYDVSSHKSSEKFKQPTKSIKYQEDSTELYITERALDRELPTSDTSPNYIIKPHKKKKIQLDNIPVQVDHSESETQPRNTPIKNVINNKHYETIPFHYEISSPKYSVKDSHSNKPINSVKDKEKPTERNTSTNGPFSETHSHLPIPDHIHEINEVNNLPKKTVKEDYLKSEKEPNHSYEESPKYDLNFELNKSIGYYYDITTVKSPVILNKSTLSTKDRENATLYISDRRSLSEIDERLSPEPSNHKLEHNKTNANKPEKISIKNNLEFDSTSSTMPEEISEYILSHNHNEVVAYHLETTSVKSHEKDTNLNDITQSFENKDVSIESFSSERRSMFETDIDRPISEEPPREGYKYYKIKLEKSPVQSRKESNPAPSEKLTKHIHHHIHDEDVPYYFPNSSDESSEKNHQSPIPKISIKYKEKAVKEIQSENKTKDLNKTKDIPISDTLPGHVHKYNKIQFQKPPVKAARVSYYFPDSSEEMSLKDQQSHITEKNIKHKKKPETKIVVEDKTQNLNNLNDLMNEYQPISDESPDYIYKYNPTKPYHAHKEKSNPSSDELPEYIHHYVHYEAVPYYFPDSSEELSEKDQQSHIPEKGIIHKKKPVSEKHFESKMKDLNNLKDYQPISDELPDHIHKDSEIKLHKSPIQKESNSTSDELRELIHHYVQYDAVPYYIPNSSEESSEKDQRSHTPEKSTIYKEKPKPKIYSESKTKDLNKLKDIHQPISDELPDHADKYKEIKLHESPIQKESNPTSDELREHLHQHVHYEAVPYYIPDSSEESSVKNQNLLLPEKSIIYKEKPVSEKHFESNAKDLNNLKDIHQPISDELPDHVHKYEEIKLHESPIQKESNPTSDELRERLHQHVHYEAVPFYIPDSSEESSVKNQNLLLPEKSIKYKGKPVTKIHSKTKAEDFNTLKDIDPPISEELPDHFHKDNEIKLHKSPVHEESNPTSDELREYGHQHVNYEAVPYYIPDSSEELTEKNQQLHTAEKGIKHEGEPVTKVHSVSETKDSNNLKDVHQPISDELSDHFHKHKEIKLHKSLVHEESSPTSDELIDLINHYVHHKTVPYYIPDSSEESSEKDQQSHTSEKGIIYKEKPKPELFSVSKTKDLNKLKDRHQPISDELPDHVHRDNEIKLHKSPVQEKFNPTSDELTKLVNYYVHHETVPYYFPDSSEKSSEKDQQSHIHEKGIIYKEKPVSEKHFESNPKDLNKLKDKHQPTSDELPDHVHKDNEIKIHKSPIQKESNPTSDELQKLIHHYLHYEAVPHYFPDSSKESSKKDEQLHLPEKTIYNEKPTPEIHSESNTENLYQLKDKYQPISDELPDHAHKHKEIKLYKSPFPEESNPTSDEVRELINYYVHYAAVPYYFPDSSEKSSEKDQQSLTPEKGIIYKEKPVLEINSESKPQYVSYKNDIDQPTLEKHEKLPLEIESRPKPNPTSEELPGYIHQKIHNEAAPYYFQTSNTESSEIGQHANIPSKDIKYKEKSSTEIYSESKARYLNEIKSLIESHVGKMKHKSKKGSVLDICNLTKEDRDDVSSQESRRSSGNALDLEKILTNNNNVPNHQPKFFPDSTLSTAQPKPSVILQPKYHLMDPTKGAGISTLNDPKTRMMESTKVCYACSTLNDSSCWAPDRRTTVKYCRPGYDLCVTKIYESVTSIGKIVIRDCNSACDVKTPGLDIHYDSCAICKEDLCNNLPIENSAFTFSQSSLLPIIVISGMIKFMY